MKDIEMITHAEHTWGWMPFYMGQIGFVKLPDCGTCSIVVGTDEGGFEHVSVSPKHKYRIPTWDDMCALKDLCFDDEEEVYEIHPKKSEYVNMQENCLHLWRPANGKCLYDLVKGGE